MYWDAPQTPRINSGGVAERIPNWGPWPANSQPAVDQAKWTNCMPLFAALPTNALGHLCDTRGGHKQRYGACTNAERRESRVLLHFVLIEYGIGKSNFISAWPSFTNRCSEYKKLGARTYRRTIGRFNRRCPGRCHQLIFPERQPVPDSSPFGRRHNDYLPAWTMAAAACDDRFAINVGCKLAYGK